LRYFYVVHGLNCVLLAIVVESHYYYYCFVIVVVDYDYYDHDDDEIYYAIEIEHVDDYSLNLDSFHHTHDDSCCWMMTTVYYEKKRVADPSFNYVFIAIARVDDVSLFLSVAF